MDLEQENRRLQQNTEMLLARIEENQKIQQRFQAFEQQLLACTGLPELLEQLLDKTLGQFELADITLVINDPDYSTRELLQLLDIDMNSHRLQLNHNPDFLAGIYGQQPQVRLGPVVGAAAGRLFPGGAPVSSAALLPLLRQSHFSGSLHLGSDSPERFSADKATDFMVHLAMIVAVCLENCLAREHLKRQGQMDMLTQVSNRRHFDAEFSRELARAERTGEPLSCMFVDADHFKNINDSYGHQAGDLCLKTVAGLVQQQLRKTDLLARYGGEEFVVLLPRCEQRQARLIAERVRMSIEEFTVPLADAAPDQLSIDNIPEVNITVSIGVSSWQPRDGRMADLPGLGQQLLGCADQAMYKAKQEGRNRVRVQHFVGDAGV